MCFVLIMLRVRYVLCVNYAKSQICAKNCVNYAKSQICAMWLLCYAVEPKSFVIRTPELEFILLLCDKHVPVSKLYLCQKLKSVMGTKQMCQKLKSVMGTEQMCQKLKSVMGTEQSQEQIC